MTGMAYRLGNVLRLVLLLTILLAPSFRSSSLTAQTPKSLVQVPVVGCKSDGQVGTLDAPKPSVAKLPLDPAMAEKLALYKAKNGPEILGPIGWSCFGYYGSGSSHLNLTAATADPKTGEAAFIIQGWLIDGGTSGRFTVADFVARVFPAYRSFSNHVAAEKVVDGLQFPAGPFPDDRLTYRSDRIVEYETPMGTKGLGTYFLTPNASSVRGVTVLTPDSNIRHLAVRLPLDKYDMATIIIQEFEAGLPK